MRVSDDEDFWGLNYGLLRIQNPFNALKRICEKIADGFVKEKFFLVTADIALEETLEFQRCG